MKFFIKDFFSECDQIRNFLQFWSHLLKKSLIENFIFCAVWSKSMYFADHLAILIKSTISYKIFDTNSSFYMK